MAGVGGVNGTGSTQQTASSQGGLGGLDGNAFLTLLTAQLKSQDPTSAQDPSTFVAQLSSFSQLEQLINIRQGIDTQNNLQAEDKINAALQYSQGVSAQNVTVAVSGNNVTLKGTVPSINDLTSVLNIVKANDGGRTVDASGLSVGK